MLELYNNYLEEIQNSSFSFENLALLKVSKILILAITYGIYKFAIVVLLLISSIVKNFNNQY